MDDSTISILDGLSATELAEIEQDARKQLCEHGRHLVGLMAHYQIRHANTWRPAPAICRSTVVVEIRGQWYLLTAGHVIKELVKMKSDSNYSLICMSLDDTFSPDVKHKDGIDGFDFDLEDCFYEDTDPEGSIGPTIGVDFGLIHLRPYYRDQLLSNGIQPVNEQMWDPDEIAKCTFFLVVGFQQELTESAIYEGYNYYQFRIQSRPSWIVAEKTTFDASDHSSEFPRFHARVGPDRQVGDLKGLSGGPIFGSKGSLQPYYLVGIQASWVSETRETYGTPIHVVLDRANSFLRKVEARFGDQPSVADRNA